MNENTTQTSNDPEARCPGCGNRNRSCRCTTQTGTHAFAVIHNDPNAEPEGALWKTLHNTLDEAKEEAQAYLDHAISEGFNDEHRIEWETEGDRSFGTLWTAHWQTDASFTVIRLLLPPQKAPACRECGQATGLTSDDICLSAGQPQEGLNGLCLFCFSKALHS